jgi:LmbE family N-acetylglucosaminyl deacetylase
MARYARKGAEVHLCTVTDGAAGELDRDLEPAAETPSLDQLRGQELECACQVLGVELHTLGYRDSGMEGAPDNGHPDSLYQADLDRVARELVAVIGQTRPQVLITHNADGGYYHPDHIKVHRAVRRAWDMIGDDETYTEVGAGGHEPRMPERLYCSVIPRSALKWFVLILRLLGRDPRRFGQNQDVDLTQVGIPDENIQVRLDVGPYVKIKEEVSACHRSQGGRGAQRILPAFLRRRFMRYEFFVQLEPPGAQPHTDLLAGLDVEDLR